MVHVRPRPSRLDPTLLEAWCDECRAHVELAPAHVAAFRAEHAHTGLGDAFARLSQALGVTPCGGCKKRAAALNAAVPRVPWR